MSDNAALNTDRELYREGGGDGNGQSYYEPSIHVTEHGAIGMNVGGHVITTSIRGWHEMATGRDRLVAEAKVEALLDAAKALDVDAFNQRDQHGGHDSHGARAAERLAERLRWRARQACLTCSWPNRETVDMVCQTCGTDYAAQSEDRAKVDAWSDDPLPADECTNHASNFLLPDGRYQCLICSLQFVGCEPCDTSGRWTLMYGEGDNGECPACDGTGAAGVEKAAVCTCGEPLDEHPDGPPCPPPPPPGTPFA